MSDQTSNEQQTPSNPGSEEKSQLPDADRTASANASDASTASEMTDKPVGEGRFTGEHSISPDHAEPTDVTGTSNDTYTDSEYIDVGGGD